VVVRYGMDVIINASTKLHFTYGDKSVFVSVATAIERTMAIKN